MTSVHSAPPSTVGLRQDEDRDPLAAGFTAVNGTIASAPGFRTYYPRSEHTISARRHHRESPPSPESNPREARRHSYEQQNGAQFPEEHESAQRPEPAPNLDNLGKRKRSSHSAHSASPDARTNIKSPMKRTEMFDPARSASPPRVMHSSVWQEQQSNRQREAWPSRPPRSSPDAARRTEKPLHNEAPAEKTRFSDSPDNHSERELYTPHEQDDTQVDEEGENHDQSPETSGSRRPHRKRAFANRVKTGCHTCRGRKKKCDEAKPHCTNCIRGGFICKGYGEKRPPSDGTRGATNDRQNVRPYNRQNDAIAYDPRYPRTQPTQPSSSIPWPGSTHTGQFRREPTRPSDEYRSEARDLSLSQRGWSSGSTPGYPPAPSRLADYGRPLSQIDTASEYERNRRISSAAHYGRPVEPAPFDHQRGEQDSSRSTLSGPIATESSHTQTNEDLRHWSEKQKMLQTKAYRHYDDRDLVEDREECKKALQAFNDSHRPSAGVSTTERARLLRAVITPSRVEKRFLLGPPAHRPHPNGRVGERVIVESPFRCDYGYNIQIADNVVIQPGCVIQDPCTIRIGRGTVIGPDVKIYGMTMTLDPRDRGSGQGFCGGPITIEEDVFIGGNSTILPLRTIGKGATVGAGTVVSKDVKPYQVVAGHPMRVLRDHFESGDGPDRRGAKHIQRQDDDMRWIIQAEEVTQSGSGVSMMG